VRGAVVEHLVVDLVGEDDQLVLAGDLDDLAQQLVGIQRAGRVVGVDEDDGAGGRADLAADVGQVGQPAGALVAQVMARRAAGEAHRRRPQRVVGRRHQHLVAVVEQRLHGHHDQLGDAVADVDVVDADALDPLLLAVVHDGLARGEEALRVGVAGGVAQVVDDVHHDFLRRLETERRRIADVQLDDAMALLLHLPGARQHRSADVVADVGELGRFAVLSIGAPGAGHAIGGETKHHLTNVARKPGAPIRRRRARFGERYAETKRYNVTEAVAAPQIPI
jgi:hypothetical protein